MVALAKMQTPVAKMSSYRMGFQQLHYFIDSL